LELNKFDDKAIESDKQIWLKFFKEGEAFDEKTLPAWMNTNEMRQAMGTLKNFSEKEQNYHAYQARQNFLREQRTIQWEMEQEREQKLTALQGKDAALQEKDAALQRENAALQREDAALQEIERLKALLGKH
jgi:FtsZ-binding cell division protein ZapB